MMQRSNAMFMLKIIGLVISWLNNCKVESLPSHFIPSGSLIWEAVQVLWSYG